MVDLPLGELGEVDDLCGQAELLAPVRVGGRELLVGAVFDVGEVEETSGRFAQLFALFAVPLLALTAIGVVGAYRKTAGASAAMVRTAWR